MPESNATDRESYIDNVEQQLVEMEKSVSSMGEPPKDDVESVARMDELNERIKNMRANVEKMRSASTEDWETVRDTMDEEWEETKSLFEECQGAKA